MHCQIKIENFLLPPRGSFVIVKFSTSLKHSRNIIRGVRSLFHMILENVCVCVRACVRACVCVCVCTYIALSRIYAVDFNRIVLIFFLFFYCEFGKKIILYDTPIRFLFYFEFLIFEKFVFEFF